MVPEWLIWVLGAIGGARTLEYIIKKLIDAWTKRKADRQSLETETTLQGSQLRADVTLENLKQKHRESDALLEILKETLAWLRADFKDIETELVNLANAIKDLQKSQEVQYGRNTDAITALNSVISFLHDEMAKIKQRIKSLQEGVINDD